MRILIYCFKPYDILDDNPSQKLAHNFSQEISAETKVVELESCYSSTEEITEKSRNFQPDLLVGIGADQKVGKIQIEKIGLNIAHSENKDECGETKKDEKIIESSETALETDFPAKELKERLGKEFRVKLSFHADTYVCNMAYYRSLKYAEKEEGTQSLFLHMPLEKKQAESLEKDLPHLEQEGLPEKLSSSIEELI